jgi:transcriptional regulator with XRE-family HTH domain
VKVINLEQVGARLKRIRGDLTQKEFADILKVKQNYISRYEKGRLPGPDLLLKIARYGNVSVDWILWGETRGEPARQIIKEKEERYGEDPLNQEIIKLLKRIKTEDKRTIIKILRVLAADHSQKRARKSKGKGNTR